ncbi:MULTISPECIES: DUF2306 domain-containing protein [Paenibacillus]|uniref:DUF2306 domain-containing protein n=1 Tax=Paenibacillus TaxID=44249 RepID=UPI0022B8E77B|nr:DUF2306 domain-containing protein [Paenibacillus caseinilyticus]MCZ8522243.1 DUF2306 domain-containing protein [Paenibacillus caseinilyticus]
MVMLFDLFRWLHIAAGFLALFTFWIPMVTVKGGKAHNRSGWFYVWCMGTVAVSALYMGVYRIFLDPGSDAGRIAFSWFLIFISVLSSASAWYGLRVLRVKGRKSAHRGLFDLGFSLLLLLSGIAVSLYGFRIEFPLLQYFPFVGILLGSQQLYYWLNVPKTRKHWIIEHIGAMIGCCIATVTAFTVFGAPRLLGVDSVSILLWFMPTIVMVPLTIGFSRYYRKKFNAAA